MSFGTSDFVSIEDKYGPVVFFAIISDVNIMMLWVQEYNKSTLRKREDLMKGSCDAL